jgi:hypothetical protein
MIKVEVNSGDRLAVDLLLGELGKAAPRVLMRATNKTITGVKTEIKTIIREDTNFKARDIAKRLRDKKSSIVGQGISPGKVEVGGQSAYGRGKGFPLAAVEGLRVTTKGVTAEIIKGRGRQLIPGAFKAKMKSGHTGIFLRAGYTNLAVNGAYGSSRYSRSQKKMVAVSTMVKKDPKTRKEAIKELFTSSVADRISSPREYEVLRFKAQKRMDRAIIDELNYMLSTVR